MGEQQEQQEHHDQKEQQEQQEQQEQHDQQVEERETLKIRISELLSSKSCFIDENGRCRIPLNVRKSLCRTIQHWMCLLLVFPEMTTRILQQYFIFLTWIRTQIRFCNHIRAIKIHFT